MDEHDEREYIQEQCLRLSRCFAQVHTAPISTDEAAIIRRAIQLGQSLALNGFISTISENCFRLIRETGKAEAIGKEILEQIHLFLEGYTDLLEEEHDWSR